MAISCCVQCLTGVVTVQVCAELRQAQAKRSQLEVSEREQASELERLLQKSRELELQLARNAQSRHSTSSLQEELCAERSRLITADKKARGHTCRVSVIYSVCFYGNLAKENANIFVFPSTLSCKLRIDILITKGRLLISCGIKT